MPELTHGLYVASMSVIADAERWITGGAGILMAESALGSL